MKIGTKYCGGCNPLYNRVGVVERIKERLDDIIDFVSYEVEDIQGVIVIIGFPAACINPAFSVGYPVWLLTHEQDIENVIEKIVEEETVVPAKGTFIVNDNDPA